MVKFSNQFFSGLIVGAVLGGLLMLALAWNRIEENATFADQNMRLFGVWPRNV